MPKNTIILYGSYGYTGNLIAKECRSKNLDVILSGRNAEALQKQSERTNYPFEVVDINNSVALKNLLAKLLLNEDINIQQELFTRPIIVFGSSTISLNQF